MSRSPAHQHPFVRVKVIETVGDESGDLAKQGAERERERERERELRGRVGVWGVGAVQELPCLSGGEAVSSNAVSVCPWSFCAVPYRRPDWAEKRC